MPTLFEIFGGEPYKTESKIYQNQKQDNSLDIKKLIESVPLRDRDFLDSFLKIGNETRTR